MKNRSLSIAVALLFAILALSIAFWLKRQLQIDGCLDGGGKWDYEAAKCVGAKR